MWLYDINEKKRIVEFECPNLVEFQGCSPEFIKKVSEISTETMGTESIKINFSVLASGDSCQLGLKGELKGVIPDSIWTLVDMFAGFGVEGMVKVELDKYVKPVVVEVVTPLINAVIEKVQSWYKE